MFSDREVMELLSHGHAFEWSGGIWRLTPRPEPEEAGAFDALPAWSPTIDVGMACAGNRMAAVLREAG